MKQRLVLDYSKMRAAWVAPINVTGRRTRVCVQSSLTLRFETIKVPRTAVDPSSVRDMIEETLREKGDPVRWAINRVDKEGGFLLVDAVYSEQS
mmetsp:Transcript_29573/g.114137  ORF Transcript_29573/g.114137 Transcript_29573/m.114137 type:complete len:94 (+) Transcript_29573:57-338(+)